MQTKLLVVWVAISLAGLAGFSSAVAQTGAVAVVVSEKNPVTNVSTPELRKLFAGEKHFWIGGLPVKLFVRVVLLKLLGMSESEYKQLGIRLTHQTTIAGTKLKRKPQHLGVG
jgi:hypothetical protein